MTSTLPAALPQSLADRYRVLDGQVLLTGIQALARLPVDQHRMDRRNGLHTATFVSGYEGSPLAGYDLELGRQRELLAEHEIVFQPGLNEETAATAVAGSQLSATAGTLRYDGVLGLWYGKAPGLDRASDAIRHANYMGTQPAGGALALVGDDPGAKSSSVPCASEFTLADLGLPTFYPADQQEILDLGMHAVALSRASGLWSALKIATAVADGSGTVTVHPERITPVLPQLTLDGAPYRHTVTGKLLQPTLGKLERELHAARLELALRYARLNPVNQITHRGQRDRIGLVAAGKTWLDLRQALRMLGMDETELARHGIRLLKLGMVFPLDEEIICDFADGLSEIVVVEEKRSFIETAIKAVLYGRTGAPLVSGKSDPDGAPLCPPHGELDPDLVAGALVRRILAHQEIPSVRAYQRRGTTRRSRVNLPLLARTPYFCSGCPHNTSTKPLPGSLHGAGIGCHAMTLLMEPAQVGEVTGLTQMGGEGAQWLGMAPFVEERHLVQNLGDGTFAHSGSLAVRAAVAAGAQLTFKLLYNSAVAMTGGQRAVGALSVPAITQLLSTEGVSKIIVTTDDPRRYRKTRLAAGTEVWHRERLAEAQRVLAEVPGVTVLIHDQECAAEKRRKCKRGKLADPAQRVVINERVCEGCGDCGQKSNCLSVQPVQTEFGRKTRIDQSSCNKDYSCLDGDCPSFLVVRPGTRTAASTSVSELAAESLPEPPSRVRADEFSMRITGIGGTGVLTVAQILATAAAATGRHVRGLDQTGLAQKGGAVVSDLKISSAPLAVAGRLAEGECDLYLGCDLLVAAEEKQLAAARRDRTVAVVSTTEVPTGQMVVTPEADFPDQRETVGRIRDVVLADSSVFVDARRISTELFGDDQYANILLTGVAYQAGALPLAAAEIERAIELNGTSVWQNVQAFRRGRQAVADPEALRADLAADRAADPAAAQADPVSTPAARHLAEAVRAAPGSELARLLAVRVPDLVGYQDLDYARRYVELVERVRRTEAERVPDASALAEAVAANLHHLMAYKDEYEVARLSLRPEFDAELRARFGPDARYAWKLHPPVLRALGMRRKITLGPWFRPAFRLLYAMRRLRGSRLDPFGIARLRRVERALIVEYEAVLEELLADLDAHNHDMAVRIASLPALVRGYEQIKLDNVRRYREQLAELRGSRQTVQTDGRR